MRKLVLSLTVLASTAVVVPALPANAQGMPMGYGAGVGHGGGYGMGYGQMPMGAGMAPRGGVAAAGTAGVATNLDPAAACRLNLARVAYPIVVQLLQYANAAPYYPVAPNGRPIVGPTAGYPWAGPVYGPFGSPYWQTANVYGAQAFNGALQSGGFGQAALNGGATYADLVGNVFAANEARLAIVENRLGAAGFNLELTAFPYERVDNLSHGIEGLAHYAELACDPLRGNGGNGDSNGRSSNGHGHSH